MERTPEMMNKKEDPVFKRSEESYAKNRIYMQKHRTTDAYKEAQRKYGEKITQVKLTLNPERDADILDVLDLTKPLAPQITDLVRLALKAREMFQ